MVRLLASMLLRSRGIKKCPWMDNQLNGNFRHMVSVDWCYGAWRKQSSWNVSKERAPSVAREMFSDHKEGGAQDV